MAKDFSYTLLDPRDLRDFTGLNTSAVIQRMNVYLGVGVELVKWHLEGMYGRVEEGNDEDGKRTLRVIIDMACRYCVGANVLSYQGHGCRRRQTHC